MIIAVVGMTGSGKSTVAEMLRKKGCSYLRLGQMTLDKVNEAGLEPTEENERPIREQLREKYGMAAFAKLNRDNINALRRHHPVVIDNLTSWEEYLELSKYYGRELVLLAIIAPPQARYKRLGGRIYDPGSDPKMEKRPSTAEAAQSRDVAEIQNLNKAGPIAMAHYNIVNEGTIEELQVKVNIFSQLYLGK